MLQSLRPSRRLAALVALPIAAGLAAPSAALPALQGTADASAGEGQASEAASTDARRIRAVEQAIAEPLVVGGEKIPTDAIRRALAYSAGKQIVEGRKMDIFIQEEIERQVQQGVDRAKFAESDDQVAEQMDTTMDRLEEEFPDEDPAEILGARFIDQDALRGMVAQTQLFDRVFLPENPHEYPATTVQALQGQAGQEFLDKLIEGYDTRVEQGIEVDENDSGHLMWKNIMRQFVMKALDAHSEIRTASDGIPADAVLVVNGKKILTEDVFGELIETGRINPHDVQRMRRWLAKTAAVEKELKESGDWLGDEAFAEVWEEEEEPYRDSPFSLDVIAVGFRKFPSVDAYRRYFRLMKSYENRIADEITDEALEQHLDERANEMLGLGKVRADVILLSAYEPGTLRLREDGWAGARRRAVEAATKLAEGESWDAVLEEYSDFTDMPVPKSQVGNAPPSYNKGRFPALHRNELVQRLGESDFWHFLAGHSVVDHVFFDQEVGTVDGPFEGIMGYYITRVVQRVPSAKKLSLETENQKDLVRQDYLQVRFNQFAEEVLGEAEVAGLAAR